MENKDTGKDPQLYELVNELVDIVSSLYLIANEIQSREELAVGGASKETLFNAVYAAINHIDRVRNDMYKYC